MAGGTLGSGVVAGGEKCWKVGELLVEPWDIVGGENCCRFVDIPAGRRNMFG
jgi:hypothetical protein